MKLHEIVKIARRGQGVSQATLADILGVTVRTIGRLESGMAVSFETRYKLRQHFGDVIPLTMKNEPFDLLDFK